MPDLIAYPPFAAGECFLALGRRPRPAPEGINLHTPEASPYYGCLGATTTAAAQAGADHSKSGDNVVYFHTLLTNSPAGPEHNAIAPADVRSGASRSFQTTSRRELPRGPGGHILTGPVFIEGADPGDTREIPYPPISIPVAIPYAYTASASGRGPIHKMNGTTTPYARQQKKKKTKKNHPARTARGCGPLSGPVWDDSRPCIPSSV